MGSITGSELLAKSLKAQGMDTLFYLMGGPMLETESACIKLGVRAIDSRHEQGASMMAHAYSRLTRRPGVCMASSGPGTINMATGVANAFIDAAPLVAVGGASPRVYFGMDAFQEVDQLSLFKPITKWATRILDAKRIPDVVATAFRQATSGRPGPVFLDLPGDILGEVVDESSVTMPARWRPAPRAHGDPAAIAEAIALLGRAERPLIIAGSGVWWSDAASALQTFVETAGIPFYTTPISRGSVPEDHDLAFLFARAKAFSEADVILNVGGQERLNFGPQSIPTFTAGHRLNSGPFGCMGVGLPFGVGAKVACPDTQVVILHGDGSYGINAMEFDTAVRHRIPVLVVISNNGGWTADPKQDKPGRNLGYTRYDKVAEDFGGYGEFVEKPHEIRPALARAYTSGKPAVVNVKTDYKARATTVRFSAYTT